MRKLLVVIIWVSVLLVALNCGCTDDGGNSGNGTNEQENDSPF